MGFHLPSPKDAWHAVGHVATSAEHAVGHAATSAQHTAGHITTSAEHGAASLFRGAMDDARSGGHFLAHAASSGANLVKTGVNKVDAAKDKVGSLVDSAEKGWESTGDHCRAWARQHWGVAGQVLSDASGFGQGQVKAVYGAAKGLVQLEDGVESLANPLEWAANPEANRARLKSVGTTTTTALKVGTVGGWLSDPKGNTQMVSHLWHSASTSFEKDPSKVIGEVFGTVGTMVIPGGGEAAAAGDAARAAEVAGDAGKLADAGRAVTTASRGAESAGLLGDAGKGTTVAGEVTRGATATEDAASGAMSAESIANELLAITNPAIERYTSRAVEAINKFADKGAESINKFVDRGAFKATDDAPPTQRPPTAPEADAAPRTQAPATTPDAAPPARPPTTAPATAQTERKFDVEELFGAVGDISDFVGVDTANAAPLSTLERINTGSDVVGLGATGGRLVVTGLRATHLNGGLRQTAAVEMLLARDAVRHPFTFLKNFMSGFLPFPKS